MKMIQQSFIDRRFYFFVIIIPSLIILALLLTRCKKDDKGDTVANTSVDVKQVADGFVSPIGLVASPDNTGRLFVIDQAGKIWIVDSTGAKLPTPFMDISSTIVALNPAYDERGLLGLAFHPQFATNRRFYVYYQLPPRPGGPTPTTSWNNLSRISEFKASATNGNVVDMTSEKILLDIDDPQSNHNGGTIAFGPDGYLYIAIGDGGAANDVAPGHVDDWYAANAGGNGQDVEANLFGNVLRIDVNTGSPYGIPPDNPFVATSGKDEIYAYGFRNPFRMSFDMGGNHSLYLGDAGQVLYEEINVVTKGGNYGWNVKEGRVCFNAANNDTALASCPTMDNLGKTFTDPVIVINNTANPLGGRALTVIGGNVYRGNAIPAYQGKYIFGTYAQSNAPNGELFISTPSSQSSWDYQEINLASHPDDIGYYLKGFGQDNKGEIYLTVSSNGGPSGTTGKILKLVKAP
ncbi:MAG: PQQ-dependent sugar dehydrogenase [Bacteroidetes bacterium]|jgi:glucose/arabinose dehydrogenase|nr:MAG: PQQ-dependent sugar dehydrogenase [Bacteroidota bacterium]